MAIDTNLNKLVINKLTKAQYQEAKQSNSIVETEIYMITDKEDIDADTLGGHPASEFATQSFVTNKIAEASLSGSDVDLSGYVSKDGSTTMTGNLQMGGKKVVNLGTPTADTDAATKGYVDALQSEFDTHNHDSLYDTKGAAADSLASAKSYTDGRVNIIRVTTANENLNNYVSQGIYYFVDGSTPVNIPENNNNGYLIVLPSLNYIKQIWLRAGSIDFTSSQTFVRTAQKGDDRFYWSAWEKFVTDADVIPVAQGGTGKASLTSGQVLVGNGTGAVTQKAIDTSAASGSANLITSGAVYTGLAGKSDTSHKHAAGDITSGTLGSARLPTVPVTKGGTGATDAITAAATLGLITGKNLTETEYEIASNTDLNTITTVGAYRVGSSSVTQSLTNAPPVTNAGFRLHVIHTTTSAGFIQIAIYNATAPTIYVRVCGSSGTWGDWSKVLTSVLRSGYDYGDTLPTAGTAGRIFFKKA